MVLLDSLLNHLWFVLTISGTSTIVLLWVIFRYIIPKMERDRYRMALFKMADVYESLNRVLDSTHANRFLIVKTENGGGIPHAGSIIYASVLYEAVRPPFKSHKDEYQRLRVDEEFLMTLKELLLKDFIYLEVASMPEGMLRRMYISEGVKWIYLFKIKTTKSAFYYGSIGTESPEGLRGARDFHYIEISMSKIRNLFFSIK